MAAYTKAIILLFVAVPAALASVGDTWTADISGTTLPPDSGLTGSKGTGTSTITEAVDNYFYWEVNLFKVGEFSSIDLVLGTPGLPTVFELTKEYIPKEIVYFGNFTRDSLDQQLAANGFDEQALYSANQLWLLVRTANNSGLGGQVTANAIADFNATNPDGAVEDEFELTSQVVYVAQMQNTTVSFFESGITPTNGTGSALIQDLQDGTFIWTLDLSAVRFPNNLSLHYFATLGDQPLVLKLDPNPPFEDKVLSYEGNFTTEALKNGLIAVGAPNDVIERPFNVSPPVMFLKLDTRNNGSLVGFVFDANAEPTERPILKGEAPSAAVGYQGVGFATTLAVLLSLVVFLI